VLHKGQDKVINLTLGQLPNTVEAKADTDNGDKPSVNKGTDVPKLGMTVPPPTASPAPARTASWSPKSTRRVRRPNAASRKAT
jgi:hypothetical protein